MRVAGWRKKQGPKGLKNSGLRHKKNHRTQIAAPGAKPNPYCVSFLTFFGVRFLRCVHRIIVLCSNFRISKADSQPLPSHVCKGRVVVVFICWGGPLGSVNGCFACEWVIQASFYSLIPCFENALFWVLAFWFLLYK